MGSPWRTHGAPWGLAHGVPMERPWGAYGAPMGRHGAPMGSAKPQGQRNIYTNSGSTAIGRLLLVNLPTQGLRSIERICVQNSEKGCRPNSLIRSSKLNGTETRVSMPAARRHHTRSCLCTRIRSLSQVTGLASCPRLRRNYPKII